MNYIDYTKAWMRGQYDEIDFWENYIAAKGEGSTYKIWELMTDENACFIFEDFLPDGGDFSFIDVGSGPFSRCGRKTNKCKLDIICIDPLGEIYEEIKRRYHINNGNVIRRGFVEYLDKQYGANKFDMVHMSNSLDHCFDPIFGIYQLINICKTGGKVILRHYENEALREGYHGLHQWNLSLHNQENSFMIWNNNQRIDVCKQFERYVDFELKKDITEKNGKWLYNQVIMTKKCDISIPDNEYMFQFLLGVYDEFVKLNEEMVIDKMGNYMERQRKRVISKIENGEYDSQFLSGERNIVWGYGTIGITLIERLKKEKHHYIVIDKNKEFTADLEPIIGIKEYMKEDKDRLWLTFQPTAEDETILDEKCIDNKNIIRLIN